MTSAGIILFDMTYDGLKFLLGHAGGPYHKGTNYYSFPKGGSELIDGDIKITAVREFQEETGIILTEKEIESLYYLGSVKQNRTKIVHAYALEKRVDETKCFSNEIEIEYPLKSGNFITIPEMDHYKWIDYLNIKDITHKTHFTFYQKIVDEFFTIE